MVSRRSFVTGLCATAATGALAAACGKSSDDQLQKNERILFRGERQAGIVQTAAPAGVVAGLNVRVSTKAKLTAVMRDLSSEIELVMSGQPYEERAGGYPALDTGILGNDGRATSTSVVVGVGASLFDERFGLADQIPVELQKMPSFTNDYLVREDRSHGDLSITVNASTKDAAAHAIRQLFRVTRGRLHPKWMKEGFNDILPDFEPGKAPVRNLMGFKDGTANLDASDKKLMNRHVWVQPEDIQPDWAIGGTYQAVRIIRMMVEFWDRTRLNEQESLIGRHRISGAPIGKTQETDIPSFTSLDSHIARANPRTPASEESLMLRRGFNYASGIDQNEQLDQGLIFLSYQRSLNKGFIAVQNRLDGEALEEYIRPLGGGFFFALPGIGSADYLGEQLLS